MRIEAVVVNASPLITLFRSGQADLLPRLFGRIIVPDAIRAIIDDADARRCARTLGIPLLGTGGLLVLAKRRGLLPSVTEGIEKLRDAGLWLSDGLVDLLKAQALE